MSLSHLGWLGFEGEFRIDFLNGRVTLVVTDRRYPNTRRAGVVLANERLSAIGNTLVQIASGADLETIDTPLANSRGHSMEKKES